MKTPGKRRPYARSFPPRPPLWRVFVNIGTKPASIVHVEAIDEDEAKRTALRTMHELYGRQAYNVETVLQVTKLKSKGNFTMTDIKTKGKGR